MYFVQVLNTSGEWTNHSEHESYDDASFQSDLVHGRVLFVVDGEDTEGFPDLDDLAASYGYESIQWDEDNLCYSGFGSANPTDRGHMGPFFLCHTLTGLNRHLQSRAHG